MLHSVCSHRRHLRLDNLRTLILANNQLTRIQLATDDDGDNICTTDDEDTERVNIATFKNFILLLFLLQNSIPGKAKLMFPNLSMLDVSNNNLKEIPTNIYELNNLSVLNISGNLGMFLLVSNYEFVRSLLDEFCLLVRAMKRHLKQ